jgi:tetratricopeptide (TPR) repeat protein/predicted Ser/Thr protein kinase
MSAPIQRFGKYQVLRTLGQGGMGYVYEAMDPDLNRKVALKTMMQGLVNDPSLRARFLREAQAAGSLKHRNIVTVYDLGEDQGQPFISMEFIEGTDLENVIQNRVSYPIEWKMRVLRQICDGLGHAHRNGIIHRDIKPANIRVTPEGEVKIMDFGIAHLQAPTQLTKGGQVLGTVHYMAPEQVEGHKVDHRVDIFAVGVIAYELLAFRRAFNGESLTSVMFKIAHEDPDRSALPQTTYSPRLEQIVMKALARKVEDRYQTLEEMRDDLAILLGDAPPEGDARPDPTQVSRWVAEGERELEAGDPIKALDYAKRALTMAPADLAAQTLARRAEAEALGQRVERELKALRTEIAQARQAGHLQKALTLAQRFHELDPDDQEIVRMMNEIRNEITTIEIEQLCGLALSYAAENETGLALKIAAKIEKLDAKSPKYLELTRYLEEEAGRNAANALVATAREHLALGNIPEALAAAEEALHASPSHSVALEIKTRAERVLSTRKQSVSAPTPTASQATASRAQGLAQSAAPPQPRSPADQTPPVSQTLKPQLRPTPSTPKPPLRPTTPPVQQTSKPPLRPTTTPTSQPPLRPTTPLTSKPPLRPTTTPTSKPPLRPTTTPTSQPPLRPTTPLTPKPPLRPTTTPTPQPPLRPTTPLTPKPPLRPTTTPTPFVSTPSVPPPPTERTVAPTDPNRTSLQSPVPIQRKEARPPTPIVTRPVSFDAPLANVMSESPPRAEPDTAGPKAPEEPVPLTPLPEGDPTTPEAVELVEMGRRLLRDRKPREALPYIEKAADVEPRHVGVQRLLVQTRIDARKNEIEELTTAALNHFVENRHRKARKAVDKALSLDPNNKKAKELLKILTALT